MKRNIQLLAAVFAALSLNGVAYATHQTGQLAAAQPPHGTGKIQASTATDDSPMAWKVARYPFRVGYTVVRTPLILGQAFTGKRSFISDRGLFQMNDEQAVVNEQARRDAAPSHGQRTSR